MAEVPPPNREAILKNGKKASLALEHIVCEPRVSARKCIDRAHAQALFNAVRAEADIGELVVARVEGCLSVIDGFHRFHALLRSGAERANFLILPGDLTLDEARWLSAALNWKAQLKLSNAERKDGFKAYIKAGGHVRLATSRGTPDRYKSYREIAVELGVPKSTVFRWIEKCFPSLAEAMGDPDIANVTKRTRGERLFDARVQDIRRSAKQIAAQGGADDQLADIAKVALFNAFLELADPQRAAYFSISSASDIPWETR
jgi:hypothetical protein